MRALDLPLGFPAALVGLVAAWLYLASVLFGFHRPTMHRYPTRVAFIASRDGKSGIWVLDAATKTVARVSDYDRGNSFVSNLRTRSSPTYSAAK